MYKPVKVKIKHDYSIVPVMVAETELWAVKDGSTILHRFVAKKFAEAKFNQLVADLEQTELIRKTDRVEIAVED